MAHAPSELLESPLAEVVALPSAAPTTLAPSQVWQRAKRPVDFVIALTALVVLAPVMLVIAVLVKRSSPGPIFFRQSRCGLGLEPFTVLKFRTMHDGAPPELHQAFISRLASGGGADAGELQKLSADPRVTPFGHWLRRSSLDELPQLINVLRGQMSLVGPRPAIPYELDHYLPQHFDRFQVRPGLTGLWQVSGRASLGFSEMLDMDVDYVRRAGALTDLEITVKTPLAVLVRRTA